MTTSNELPTQELEVVFAALRFISERRLPESDVTPIPSAVSASRRATGESRSASNRLFIPENVSEPFEAFRMAATNVPIDTDALQRTRAELHHALLTQYPDQSEELTRLFDKDGANANAVVMATPKPNSRPNFMVSSMYAMQSMQEIVPGLFVGSYHVATNKTSLTTHNITHVLCCIDVAPRFPTAFVYMTLPADDSPTYDIAKFFPKTFDFIENALIKQHSGVLVHCGAGISRAPTIAAAYLIRKLRIKATDAIALIQRKRAVASPNAGFRRQLQTFQKEQGI